MRKLVFILIAFIAAVTFFRVLALDGPGPAVSGRQNPLRIESGNGGVSGLLP